MIFQSYVIIPEGISSFSSAKLVCLVSPKFGPWTKSPAGRTPDECVKNKLTHVEALETCTENMRVGSGSEILYLWRPAMICTDVSRFVCDMYIVMFIHVRCMHKCM